MLCTGQLNWHRRRSPATGCPLLGQFSHRGGGPPCAMVLTGKTLRCCFSVYLCANRALALKLLRRWALQHGAAAQLRLGLRITPHTVLASSFSHQSMLPTCFLLIKQCFQKRNTQTPHEALTQGLIVRNGTDTAGDSNPSGIDTESTERIGHVVFLFTQNKRVKIKVQIYFALWFINKIRLFI